MAHINSQAEQVSSVAETTKTMNIQLAGNILPKITENGIPTSELLGDINCYDTTQINYGFEKINVTQKIRTILDGLYGKNNWMIITEKGKYVMPKLYFFVDCSGSMKDTIQRVEAVVAKLSNKKKSMEETICIKDLTTAIGKYSNGSDDLACNRGDYHEKTTEWDENWGGAVAFISNNGPPKVKKDENGVEETYYDGWPSDGKRIILVSGDEESCSSCMPLKTNGKENKVCKSLCGLSHLPSNCECDFSDFFCTNGGKWIKNGNKVKITANDIGCHGKPGNTTAYTNFAIERAKKNNVSVFFIIPNKIYPNDVTEWVNNVKRLCSETGGDVIDLRDPKMTDLKIAESLKKIETLVAKPYYITSDYEGLEKPPFSGNVISYKILFPLPCSQEKSGTAWLLLRE